MSWKYDFQTGKQVLIEGEETFRALIRKQMQEHANLISEAQALCPHLMGSNPLSSEASTSSSIVWHWFDDGLVRGVCTNCLRVFLPTDPDFLQHHPTEMLAPGQKRGNKLSTGSIWVTRDLTDDEREHGADNQFNDLDEASQNHPNRLLASYGFPNSFERYAEGLYPLRARIQKFNQEFLLYNRKRPVV